ncbi:MAG: OmpR family response regulator [Candidatus Beckwithbacteria bacterium GW2011_GWA2_43_10]|uniref:OmpR family response regulator n=1 Tax=Candidatus Beckwithbacteria bacterium GW2011_GWA2_43_10 TaxID=1618369 RepID=A0A0G1EWC3_9BACT|nr:MAG: OmpR family response regulator [Candidatus Beckwithbacteria bacterium GW2011_GWA2_43_10]
MKLLVIEDEEKLAKSLKKTLEAEGFAVDIALTGDQGYDLAFGEEYDLIILDLGLPGMDGITIAKELRSEKVTTPILMLTARDSTAHKVEGFKSGADDYLLKPFEFEELLARIQALLRRPSTDLQMKIEVGSLIIDLTAKQVVRAGQEISLSAKEYALLEYLMRSKGQIVTKQQLIDHVWDTELDPFSNTVDVYIGYLRAKIDKAFSGDKPLLKTIKGLGYKIGSL